MMEDVINERETSRPWLFKKGNPGGPGRPKGVTLKDYAREFLAKMTDEERQEFMDGLSKEVIWKMAEGNPHNTGEMRVELPPIPIDNVRKNNSLSKDKGSDKKS